MMVEATWIEIPETGYDQALGALPPRIYQSDGFPLGEPYSFRQCRVSGKGAETWHAYRIIGPRRHGVPRVEGCVFHRASEPMTVAEFMAALRRSQ